MQSRKELKKQKKTKKKWKYLWIIIGVLLVGLLIYGLYFYNKLNDTVDTMYTPLDSDGEKEDEIKDRLSNKDTINVLLLGVDEREGDRGRSDTMMFLSLNPDTEEMLMFSIPRDTRVNIPGRGEDKINHAYAFGGAELSVQTVEEFLDTTIHFYSKVNMEGLKDGVDALGGVTINNERAFSYEGHDFPEGEITLNGDAALSYARERKQDSRGDLGRNDRQQKIIDAIIQEGMSFESFTKVDSILTTVGDNVETNLQMNEMRKLFLDYRGTRDKTIREEIQGSGQTIGNGWYYVVPNEEQQRIQSVVEEHMNKK
ncbi:LCP family glycopolymer transferase [Piscibacillus halophilus]|uniref:Transcriptional attenuator, LytR family n=1 Tax=Piscibacillus halophilus TaxID=571933 RepID=A0A1H9IQ09_9BACI|nr:LCP family protein [Piscibacillus halophilus]SEQ76841.1 transcriptional attenuator, LytR family [Piscibacillus halophilus]